MPPKLNRKRTQLFTRIDEILAWEQRKEVEKDPGFVELGRYLCEVRGGQYWRLENLKSFAASAARTLRSGSNAKIIGSCASRY